MTAAATAPSRHAVEDASQVRVAVEHAASAARVAGFAGPAVASIVLAATELAENLHRHAVGGELVVVPPVEVGAPLRLLALDRGPGVARFDLCLADGYTTIGTMGVGLGTVNRLASRFDAVSEPGRGSVVAAAFEHDADGRLTHDRPPRPALFDVAALGFALSAEYPNGDDWVALRRGAGLVVAVADGLGHGPPAAEASTAVVAALAGVADRSPVEMVEAMSSAARHTRGAAVTVATLTAGDLDGGVVDTSGLGNVALVVVAPDGSTHRGVTSHGTAGHGAGSGRAVTVPFPAGGMLVLHSDGLRTQWDLAGRAALLRHDAAVVAAALWRDLARGTDDSMVVVIREGARR